MRGYFGIGVEGISKPMNVGNLMRSAHAFGASFFFAIAPAIPVGRARHADTSDSAAHMPLYTFESIEHLMLPRGCALVGVELTEAARDLPSFYHPASAAYVLGPERGSLSPALMDRCDHLIKIPAKFCINVGVAGAIVMYDRVASLGRFARRPINPRARPEARPGHVRGAQVMRRRGKRTDA